MMSKYLQIQIPKACTQSWDEMNAEQHGRYCNSCEKNVIDFTLMDDRALANFFKCNKQNVCGRFTEDQLNHDIIIPAKKIPWLKYFFQISIPAFLFSAKSTAQIGKVVVAEKHIVDKKIRSSFITKETEITCDVKTIPKSILSTNNIDPSITQTRITLGGVSSGIVIRPKKYYLFPFRNTNINQFSLYPNLIATSSKLNIKWQNTINTNQLIEIYSLTGNLLQKELIEINKKTNQQSFDLKQLLSGSYILKITDSKTNKFSSQQFLVQ